MSIIQRIAVGVALSSCVTGVLAQVQDVTAPNLTAMSFAPTTIDTTNGAATVTFNLTATDDISGLATYQFGFLNPAQTHSVGGGGSFAGGLSGSSSALATFPQFSEAGTWTLEFVFLVDRAGNARNIGTAALAAAGFPTQLTVVSVTDTIAPNLMAVSFAPTTIDTTNGPATVTFNLTATDDISGLATYQFGFLNPAQTHSVGGGGSFAGGLSGSSSASATFPQFSEAGTWTLEFVFLVDRAGNARNIGTAALAAAGFPTQLTVISVTDTMAPSLTATSFAPTTIDTTNGPASVTFNLTARDDISGLASYQFGFISPSHTRSIGGGGTFAGELAAASSATATFPQFSEIGVWTLEFVFLVDRVGNARNVGTAALAAAGFPTQLLITSPSAHLVIPSSATLWFGLTSNNSDQQFDIRAELYINGDRLVSATETRCLTGLSRSPSMAKEVGLTFGPVLDGEIASGDVLSLRLLTRMGTNPDGNPCSDGGHLGSPGLRLYYDAASTPSHFAATITPQQLQDFFLHTTELDLFDGVAPGGGTPATKDSRPLNLNHGNPWALIGEWSRTQP